MSPLLNCVTLYWVLALTVSHAALFITKQWGFLASGKPGHAKQTIQPSSGNICPTRLIRHAGLMPNYRPVYEHLRWKLTL